MFVDGSSPGVVQARHSGVRVGELAVLKEDVLEQIVDDYLKFNGYFTTHNVGFRPRSDHPEYVSTDDSVRSDVDVVGYHPTAQGIDRVLVVSCKAWQSGFDASAKLAELRGEKKNPKRATWRNFRELWVPKWSEAFREQIYALTGERNFSYRIAVTRLRGDPEAWGQDPTIAGNMDGCSVGFLPLETMWAKMLTELTTTPAASEIGRLAQLLKAAGLTDSRVVAHPLVQHPDLTLRLRRPRIAPFRRSAGFRRPFALSVAARERVPIAER
jgi:hypothetical protein